MVRSRASRIVSPARPAVSPLVSGTAAARPGRETIRNRTRRTHRETIRNRASRSRAETIRNETHRTGHETIRNGGAAAWLTRMMTHPLLDVMTNAARGVFPPVDGGVTHLPGLPDGNRAILALTGHAFIAADLDVAEVRGLIDLGIDGFGGALDPHVVLRIADGAAIGVNDVVLAASGTGRGTTLPTTTAWDEHPRVLHARHLRAGVTVFGDRRGFVTVATGLAGRTEVSVEVVDAAEFGSSDVGGLGRQFIADALGAAESEESVFAAVSPGNARSLRSFLAAGFVPIGSEVILDRSD